MPGFLLDTNTIIDYLEGLLPVDMLDTLDEIINQKAIISVISKLELLGWYQASPEDLIKPFAFVQDANVINLDDVVVSKTISLRQVYKIKLPDAIVAATAMVFNLVLISSNISDFKNIEGLQILNPRIVEN